MRVRLAAWAAALAVAALTAAAYLPALENGFVPWDDPDYVTENPHIRHLDATALVWMATTYHAGNYHPLTWLSHALDVALFGLDARAHHRTNLLLHALDTALCFALAWALIGAPRPPPALAAPLPRGAAAATTALLFGLHPIHVESVAWVAERKDVLCALFYLLALLAYLRYHRRGGTAAYGAALGAGTLALLAKPMAVTLPALLLLLDLYPLERPRRVGWRRTLLEKLPFALLAAADAGATLAAQAKAGAVVATWHLPVAARFAHAGAALLFYLRKLAWPGCLSPLYEFPPGYRAADDLPAAAAALAATLLLLWAWRRGRRLPLALWAAYAVALLPVIGLVQVGRQAAADRYAYLPGIAPELALGLLLAALVARLRVRPRAALAAAAAPPLLLALVLTPATRAQVAVWHDGVTLWRRAVACGGGRGPEAWTNLGTVYADAGRLDEAVRCYRRAAELRPDSAAYQSRLGTALARRGDAAAARSCFQRAIALEPRYAPARVNLARLALAAGDLATALEQLQRAVRDAPGYARGHSLLGAAYLMAGDVARALPELEAAVRLDPTSTAAWRNLARARMLSGDTAGAEAARARARRRR